MKPPKVHINAAAFEDKEEFIVVLCNEYQTFSDEVIDALQSLYNQIHQYESSADCLNYLQCVSVKERIFLIAPSSFTLIDDAHNFRQVDTIFIWDTASEPKNRFLTELITKYSKIVLVPSNVQQLIDAIEKCSIDLMNQSKLFNLYSHKQKSFFNLSESSASFLWFQLYKIMLVDSPIEKTNEDNIAAAKKLMLEQCFHYYRHNKTQLKNIVCFDKTYKSSNAISWYTSDTFVYKLINKALRTENIEVLHTFRYFIIDLCINLTEKHKEMLEYDSAIPSVVYRGTQMNLADIELFRANKNCLIGTSGFLSTTRNREVAKFYAGSGKNMSLIFITKAIYVYMYLTQV